MFDLRQKNNLTSLVLNLVKPSAELLLAIALRSLAILSCMLLSTHLASAQLSAADGEVDALLADIQSQQKQLEVYNSVNGVKVADLPATTPLNVLERQGKWRIVRFKSRVVTGWVSRDYVEIADGVATIKASSLNVRIKPVIDAKVITTVPRAYQAKVIRERDNFVQLKLPSGRNFAVIQSTPTPNSRPSPETEKSVTKAAQLPSPSATQQNQVLQPVVGSEALDSQGSSSGERRHKIAPGDAISLMVFGESDLSIENVRVPQSGRVSFPLIGSVPVAGKTISQVESSVSELLAQGYVRNPRLSVTIFSYRPVFIRGAVRETGSYPFTEGLTIAKAIALAGGSKNSAKTLGVNVSRDGKVVAQDLSIDSEVEVASGDVISVAEEIGVSDEAASYIYLHGEVPSPGEYQYRKGLTVEKAIVLAGGFTIRASRKKISVTRYAELDEKGKPTRLRRVKLYAPIEPGDVIVVGASWF